MIGNNIAKFRKARKIRQQDFADAIGVTRSTLSRLENGVWQPSADTMKSVSDYLGVPLGEIFFNPDVLQNNTKEIS